MKITKSIKKGVLMTLVMAVSLSMSLPVVGVVSKPQSNNPLSISAKYTSNRNAQINRHHATTPKCTTHRLYVNEIPYTQIKGTKTWRPGTGTGYIVRYSGKSRLYNFTINPNKGYWFQVKSDFCNSFQVKIATVFLKPYNLTGGKGY
jgi:hypothetical protein